MKRIKDLDISDPMTVGAVLEEATFLINNRADKESLEPVEEKLKELSSYYEARASDNRPQPCSQTKKLMIFYEACRFLEVDRDFKIDCNFNTGLITFNDNFFASSSAFFLASFCLRTYSGTIKVIVCLLQQGS